MPGWVGTPVSVPTGSTGAPAPGPGGTVIPSRLATPAAGRAGGTGGTGGITGRVVESGSSAPAGRTDGTSSGYGGPEPGPNCAADGPANTARTTPGRRNRVLVMRPSPGHRDRRPATAVYRSSRTHVGLFIGAGRGKL